MALHITSIRAPGDRKPRRRHYAETIDPQDIDPETNRPYENYSSPCIEPHPFGGGISAGDF